MRFGSMLTAFLLALAPAFAQDSAVSSQPANLQPQDLCTLEGVVVKATTGEPVRKIEVTLFPLDGDRRPPGSMMIARGGRMFAGQDGNDQPKGTVTDGNGHFIISGLAPGRYTLSAGGNGYPPQAYGQVRGRGAPTALTLAPGSHEKDIVFRLMPPGVITGTVLDEDGDPVVNAQVQAARIAYAGHRRHMLSSSGAQTNDLGEYRIFGLEPGEYVVYANQQRASLANAATEEVYLPTFYPSQPDPAQATTVRVQPGDEVSGVDINLRRVHAVLVRGQVASDSPVRLMRGNYIQLVPRTTDSAGVGLASYGGPIEDDRGDFEIKGVPPGSYWLMMNWSDGKQSLFGRTPVEVSAANVEGVTLSLSPGFRLTGRFHIDPGGNLNPTELNLWLQPVDNSGWGAGAQIKPDGSFVMDNVVDGTYRVRVGGFPEEYYVKWARAGGLDALASGLAISRGQSPGPLEIGLSLDGGRVDGTVLKDQKPYPGARVVLVPDPPNRSRDELYSYKTADALGHFSMLGLPPGDFKLFAWEPREDQALNDPEFLKDYENRGTPVHIEEKKQQYVQLELIPVEEEPQ